MDILRFFWGRYLIVHRNLGYLIGRLLILSIFPFLCCLAFLSRKKGNGYVVGIQELCGNIFTTCEALKLKGEKDVTSFAAVYRFDVNNFYDYRLLTPKWLMMFNNSREFYISAQKFFYFIYFLFCKKNFIFYQNESFLTLNLDFFLLKIAQKKVVVFHCGDDVRHRPIHNKMMENVGTEYSFPLLNDKTPNLTFIKKFYSQKLPSFLNIPIYTLMDLETFMDRPVYQFRVPQISNLHPELKKKNIDPIIVHAPSDREIKGTEIVLRAIKLLQSTGYKFEFILLENLVNEEIIKVLETADIVIDQPGLWAGRLAIEAMAHSCIVLGGNNPQYEQGSISLPIIEFKRDEKDLYKKLHSLLKNNNFDALRPNFYKSYQETYSVNAFVNHLTGVLESSIQPDLYPLLNHKKILLDASENTFQWLIIKLFVKG